MLREDPLYSRFIKTTPQHIILISNNPTLWGSQAETQHYEVVEATSQCGFLQLLHKLFSEKRLKPALWGI